MLLHELMCYTLSLACFYRAPPKKLSSRDDVGQFTFLAFPCGNWKFCPTSSGKGRFKLYKIQMQANHK